MDIDDTPEEAAFRAEARSWLDAHAIPRGHPDDFSLGLWSSQGRRPGSEASVMKLAYGRYMKALTETAIAAQGAHGLLGPPDGPGSTGDASAEDRMWLRRFLHAPSFRIAGGSDQVQATIIGDRALGLPREPRTDKHVPFHELATRRK